MSDDHRKLQNLLAEYGHSLTRIAGEKDLMKAIEQRAVTELYMEAKVFKTVATALWKDEARKTRDALQEQVDLFDRVLAPEDLEGATVSFDSLGGEAPS